MLESHASSFVLPFPRRRSCLNDAGEAMERWVNLGETSGLLSRRDGHAVVRVRVALSPRGPIQLRVGLPISIVGD